MENVPVFVGLDYHSKSVQVCVLDASGAVLVNRKCGNSVAEIGAAIGAGREVRRAAVESCCGAADLADGLIADLKWPLSLAHPGYVKRMKAGGPTIPSHRATTFAVLPPRKSCDEPSAPRRPC